MTLFIRISVYHFITALIILQLFRDEGIVGVIVPVWTNTAKLVPLMALFGIVFLVLGLALAFAFRAHFGRYKNIVTHLGVAITATLMFHTSFTLIKTSIPAMVPFWADPLFADIDKWLHGGVDPWIIVYGWAAHLPMDVVLTAYMKWWSLPVLGFLILLATVDRDEARVRRFAILYAVAWIFCGHVLATLGSSVGPIYYDRLLGGERFADLVAAVEAGAVGGSTIQFIQGALWDLYAQEKQAFGSGISAFPSVHVSSTMVFALYVHERLPKIGAVLGTAMVAVILFLS
ncbi:MAG: phosphatase PAP2 family protein, partial [Pseudomonadota bacterium]